MGIVRVITFSSWKPILLDYSHPFWKSRLQKDSLRDFLRNFITEGGWQEKWNVRVKKNQAHFQRYVQIEVYHVAILQLTTQQLEENCRTTSCQKSVEGVEGMAIEFCKCNPPQFTCTHAAMPSWKSKPRNQARSGSDKIRCGQALPRRASMVTVVASLPSTRCRPACTRATCVSPFSLKPRRFWMFLARHAGAEMKCRIFRPHSHFETMRIQRLW